MIRAVCSDVVSQKVIRNIAGRLNLLVDFSDLEDGPQHLSASTGDDIVIVDISVGSNQELFKTCVDSATIWRKHLVIGKLDPQGILKLFSEHGHLRFFVGRNDSSFELDVEDSIAQLLRKDNPHVGRFLPSTSIFRAEKIRDYANKGALLDSLHSVATSLECYQSFPANLVTVSWELLMNAIFDAFYDSASGEEINGMRTENIMLGIDEAVVFSYGYDERRFMISVRDSFGTLDPAHLLNHLCRQGMSDSPEITLGPNGGGIGIFLAFQLANALYFRVHPNKSTEVIAIFYLEKRTKNATNRIKTICVYEEDV